MVCLNLFFCDVLYCCLLLNVSYKIKAVITSLPCSSTWVGPAPSCLRVLSKEHPETRSRSGPTPVCRLCGCMCWSWKEGFWQSAAQTKSAGVLGQGHGFQKLINLRWAIYKGQIGETIHYIKFLYTFCHERSIKILQLPLSLAIICDWFLRGTWPWVGLEKQFPFVIRFMNVFGRVGAPSHPDSEANICWVSSISTLSEPERRESHPVLGFFLTSPGHVVQIKPSTDVPESKTCLGGKCQEFSICSWIRKQTHLVLGLPFWWVLSTVLWCPVVLTCIGQKTAATTVAPLSSAGVYPWAPMGAEPGDFLVFRNLILGLCRQVCRSGAQWGCWRTASSTIWGFLSLI